VTTAATKKPTVVQALAAVAADVREVRKDSRNSSQNFNFRGIDAVMNAVGPAFRSHDVLCLPVTEDVHYEPMPLSGGKTATRCVVRVRYVFHGPAGDTVDALVVGESFDMGDKATAKAYSVAYRTCLLQTLTIPTDDVDPDEQSYERDRHPEPEPMATPEQVAEFNAAKDELGEQQQASLRAWFHLHMIPKPEKATHAQIVEAITAARGLHSQGGTVEPDPEPDAEQETLEVGS
jgi:hypothetical protein